VAQSWSSGGGGVSRDFGLAVQLGQVAGVSFNNTFGRNPATVTGDAIWQISSAYTTPPTASLCNVVSSSTDDDGSPTGVGAWTVRISGINELFDAVTEDVVLNGTSNVSTVNRYWHINTAYVLTSSTAAGSIGTITITTTAVGTAVLGNLAIGYNQTQSSIYMVPRNYTAYIYTVECNVQNLFANKAIDIGLFVKNFGGAFRIQADFHFISDSGTNFISKSYEGPFKVDEKSIIMGKCVSATDTFDVAFDYSFFLVAN